MNTLAGQPSDDMKEGERSCARPSCILSVTDPSGSLLPEPGNEPIEQRTGESPAEQTSLKQQDNAPRDGEQDVRKGIGTGITQ